MYKFLKKKTIAVMVRNRLEVVLATLLASKMYIIGHVVKVSAAMKAVIFDRELGF